MAKPKKPEPQQPESAQQSVDNMRSVARNFIAENRNVFAELTGLLGEADETNKLRAVTAVMHILRKWQPLERLRICSAANELLDLLTNE